MRDGAVDATILEEQGPTWMASFLGGLSHIGGNYTTWLVLLAAAVCALFEWRVRSENKSLIRLSAWGTAALGLMVAAILTAASLVLPFMLTMPAAGRIARPFAELAIGNINTSMAVLEQSLVKNDWESIQ